MPEPSRVNRGCAETPEKQESKSRVATGIRKSFLTGELISIRFCMLHFQINDFVKLLIRKFFSYDTFVFVQ